MIPIALRVAHLCPNWSYEVRQRIAMFLTMLPLLLVPSEERFSRRSTPKPPTCICSLAHHYCLWSIAISIALVFRGHWCQRNHCSSTKTCTFSVRVKNTCLELVFQTFWFGYRLGNIFHACALLVECCLSGWHKNPNYALNVSGRLAPPAWDLCMYLSTWRRPPPAPSNTTHSAIKRNCRRQQFHCFNERNIFLPNGCGGGLKFPLRAPDRCGRSGGGNGRWSEAVSMMLCFDAPWRQRDPYCSRKYVYMLCFGQLMSWICFSDLIVFKTLWSHVRCMRFVPWALPFQKT